MNKTLKLTAIPALTAVMLMGGALAGYASIAAAQSSTTGPNTAQKMSARGPHIGGSITAINGSTITITAGPNRDGGTYTIDASNATFLKDGASATLSSFVVGDRIFVEGTISGTNVVATKIGSGPAFGRGEHGRGGPGMHAKGPGVMGVVSAVNGSTITVTGKNGTSYTVNASGATVKKLATGSLSDIVVGDTIGVHGTVSGTSVTATTIMDDVPQIHTPTP